MAQRQLVFFSGFRQFDRSRKEANDALWALILGTRLSSHLLSANAGSRSYVSDIYPAVERISRLHLKTEHAKQLLVASEAHLVSMGIPYVWIAYEGLAKATVALLRIDGNRKLTRGEQQSVAGHQAYISSVVSPAFSSDDVLLIDLVRLLRNAIVHDGGAPTKKLVSAYEALTSSALSRWERYAGRALDLANPKVELLAGELIASLAVTKHMAYKFNETLKDQLSIRGWTVAIVDDFAENYPVRIPRDVALRDKKISGWNRMYYKEVSVADRDVIMELATRKVR